MEVKTYSLEGLLLIKPKVFGDERGFFMESYNRRAFTEVGIVCEFVQDNHSKSVRGTLRGLHYQVNQPQSKLLRVIQGEIYDVAVDIRPDSPTFGQWEGVVLSAENRLQFFVPAGFAHGFQVLSETAEVLYKCDNFYSPPDERGIIWNDPHLNIDWDTGHPPVLSDKDQRHPTFDNLRLD